MKEERTYIIAIDFDGTICRGGFPDISKGTLINGTINKMEKLLHEADQPVEFILWTCRSGEKLQDAKDFCSKHELPIKLYNQQHPETEKWLEGCHEMNKIFAHEYWDDRAVTIVDVNVPERKELKRKAWCS